MTKAGKPTILIVEDNADIVEIVRYNLERDGYTLLAAGDGEDGLKLAISKRPALILLDLMLPKVDGLEVCRLLRARAETREIPIVMLTAKGEESDVVVGLEVGADDYVVKPFSPKELVARIKAVLRRNARPREVDKNELLQIGKLQIDSRSHRIHLGTQEIKVTRTEFRLLRALAGAPGRVFTRDQLIDEMGGPDVVIIDRNVDVHISSVRKKLGTYGDRITTVRGVGYRFEEE
jgi:phosphate regulon transcriptional regulator PhoB